MVDGDGRAPERVGVYPGSFDPPTIAHVHLAEQAAEQLGLDRVELVISVDALGKDDGTLTPIAERVAALEELAASHPRLAAGTTTRRLLADIAQGYDAVVLGADKWHQLLDPGWYGGEAERDAALRRLPTVALAARPPWTMPGDDPDAEPLTAWPWWCSTPTLPTTRSRPPPCGAAVMSGGPDRRPPHQTGPRPSRRSSHPPDLDRSPDFARRRRAARLGPCRRRRAAGGRPMAIDAPPHLEPPAEAPVPRRSGRGPVALIVVVGLVLVLVGGVAFATSGGDDATAPTNEQPPLFGRPVEPAKPRAEFTLTDTDGQPYDFATETAGQLTFLFFGYTNCPDICPISLATLTQALADQNRVGAKVVFVTTDPSRDTPERLDQWLSSFPVEVVGLTGTLEQLEGAQRAAGVTAAVAEAPDADGNYTVGHSSAMNVYTPDDLQHLSYPAGTMQAEWMDDLPRIAADPAWNLAKGITVSDAYAGPSTAGSNAVYLTIANGGNDDTLVAVSSPDATGASLHGTDGTTMVEADQVDLPSGGGVVMAPGGAHIMIEGLTRELVEGDTVTVVLRFESSPPATIVVPVVGFDALAARIGE